jgi:PEP-CTERM putative exosortase interaction domain
LLVLTLALASQLNATSGVDLVNFGSASFTVDPGSTATYTQDLVGITMNTTPALGDTWYNSSMIKLVDDWSGFTGFDILMSVAGVNPALPFSFTLYDTNFESINEYQANTASAGLTLTGVPLDLSLPGNGNFADVQYLQFTWGGGGSAVNVTTTGLHGVPEPSTYALLGLAGLALAGYAVRRRRA